MPCVSYCVTVLKHHGGSGLIIPNNKHENLIVAKNENEKCCNHLELPDFTSQIIKFLFSQRYHSLKPQRIGQVKSMAVLVFKEPPTQYLIIVLQIYAVTDLAQAGN